MPTCTIPTATVHAATAPQSQSVGEQVRWLLDENAVAQMLGVSVAFLRKDRYGPRTVPVLKIGDLIRYCPNRVREAMLARENGGPRGSRRRGA